MPAYRVTLLPDEIVFDGEADQTMLEAAEAAGVRMIAGCRTGACLTCAVRHVEGRVHLPSGTALTDEMLAAHVILPCVTTAEGEVVVQTGRRGKTLLHPRHLRPWTD